MDESTPKQRSQRKSTEVRKENKKSSRSLSTLSPDQPRKAPLHYSPDPDQSFPEHALPEVVSYCISSDLHTLIHCSKNVEEVLGCPLHQVQSNGSLFLRHIHSDDKFRVLNTLEESLLSKQPMSIAYRWIHPTRNTPIVLVNHCSPAFSEQGEVLSGVILHLTPEITKEISFVSGTKLPIETDHNTHFSSLLLDESLTPLSELSNDSTVAFNVINETDTAQRLRDHLEEREEDEATEHIFQGNTVYLATLRKIIKDTFTPYFLLTICDVSQSFLEKEELKSLRRSRAGITALLHTLKSFEVQIAEQEELTETKPPQFFARTLQLLKETRRVIETHDTKPYIEGSTLVLQALNQLSQKLPSRVQMRVELPEPSFWVWTSVAAKVERQLLEISDWTVHSLPEVDKIQVSLEHSDNSTFSLFIEISTPKRDIPPSGTPEESFSRIKTVPTSHQITRTLVVHDESTSKTYEIRLLCHGSFFDIPTEKTAQKSHLRKS